MRFARCLLLTAILGSWSCSSWLTSATFAQDEYKSLEPNKSLFTLSTDTPDDVRKKKDRERNIGGQVRDVLTGKVPLAEKQSIVEAWYVQFVFPKMTLYTPEALKELPGERTRFMRDGMLQASSPEAHEFLLTTAMREMSKIVNDSYHPAVRYNAMLIIGELNKVEIIRTGNNPVPPEPYLPALDFMLKFLDDPKQPEALRIAAFIGVLRHAEMEALYKNKPSGSKIPQPQWDKIRKLAMDLIHTTQPPAGRTEAGHQWLRRMATETVGWLATAKPDPEIVNELVTRVGMKEEHRRVRCEAAVALGNVLLVPPVTINSRTAAQNIMKFIADAAEQDIERLKSLRAASIAEKALVARDGLVSSIGPGGESRGGRPSGGSGYAEPDRYSFRLDPYARRLKHEIGCAMFGLLGTREKKRIPSTTGVIVPLLKKGDAAADVKAIDEMAKELTEFSRDVVADETDPFIDSLGMHVKQIRLLIQTPLGARPAAAPAEEVEPTPPPAATPAPTPPANGLPAEAPEAPPAAPKAAPKTDSLDLPE